MCVYVCVCVCAQRTGQSDQFKTVRNTDFKSDKYVCRDSPDMTLIFFSKRGRGQGYVTPEIIGC